MKKQEFSKKPLKPLTFKVPKFMYQKIEELIEKGEFDTKADLIRAAIQSLIFWELKIPTKAAR